jgi:hypothetical protein
MGAVKKHIPVLEKNGINLGKNYDAYMAEAVLKNPNYKNKIKVNGMWIDGKRLSSGSGKRTKLKKLNK